MFNEVRVFMEEFLASYGFKGRAVPSDSFIEDTFKLSFSEGVVIGIWGYLEAWALERVKSEHCINGLIGLLLDLTVDFVEGEIDSLDG